MHMGMTDTYVCMDLRAIGLMVSAYIRISQSKNNPFVATIVYVTLGNNICT